MPIQINLMTDALADQELRKRDPAKRAVYVGVLAVVVMLVWYSSILLEHMVAKSNLDQIQSQIQARTNEYNLALASLRTLHTGENRLKSLDDLSSARFLQGNLMNALQQLYVSNVNLMRIEISQHYAGSGADAKAAGSQLGANLEQGWICLRGDSDLGEVGVQAHTVPTGRLQILHGAHEGAGTATHGSAQSAEVAARLRHQKGDSLLRLRRHGDKNALLARLTAPSLHACKPLGGRRVGDSAQKGNNQNIMGGLALRQVGMHPQSVAGLEIRHLADG